MATAAEGTSKDSISELVKKLLTLDEGERRNQLASLSEYTKEPSWIETTTASIASKTNSNELKLASPASIGSTRTGHVSSAGSARQDSGSGDDAGSGDNSCDDSSGKETTGTKEADWLSTPPGLPQPADRKAAPPPGVLTPQGTMWKAEQQKQQQEVAWALPSEFAEAPGMESDLQASLAKALTNLSGSLPPQAAAVAQQLMALTEGGKPETGRQRMQALQSFRQHLEWQQEESLQKISRILQAQRDEQPVPAPYGPMDTNAQSPFGVQMYVGPQSLADYSSEAWQYGPASVVPHFSLPETCQAGRGGQFARGGLPPRGPRTLAPNWWKPAKGQDASGQLSRGTRRAAGTRPTATGAQGVAQENGSEYTLRNHLRELQKVELSRIILIRKISKLGFDSAPILEAHYSYFGKVEKVLVAHSHVKPQHCGQGTRLRPSGLGFVVMSQPSEVEAILAAGENQFVHGVKVQVRHFERRGTKDDGEIDEADLDADNIC